MAKGLNVPQIPNPNEWKIDLEKSPTYCMPDADFVMRLVLKTSSLNHFPLFPTPS